MESATREDTECVGEFEENVPDDGDSIIKSIEYISIDAMGAVATDGMNAAADDGMDIISDNGMDIFAADDGMEAATDDGMETVTDDGIRDRFQLFFSIHPDLKPDDLVNILKSSGWNERVTLRKVYELNHGYDLSPPQNCLPTPTLDSNPGLTPNASCASVGYNGSDESLNGDLPRARSPIVIDDDTTDGEHYRDWKKSTILDNDDSSENSSSEEDDESFVRVRVPRVPRVPASRKRISGDAKATEHTTVTRWIGRLVGGLYVKTLLVCNGDDALNQKGGLVESYVQKRKLDGLIDITVNRDKLREQGWSGRDYTDRVELIPPVKWVDKKSLKKFYVAAFIDKDQFLPGDCITVRAGIDDREHLTANGRLKRNIKETAARVWFARIVNIFGNKRGEPMAHVRWFSHGGDTFLDETAGPKELFLLDRCDDIEMSTIAGKVNVERCTQIGPSEEGDQFKKPNSYFYRFFYDDDDTTPVRFEDATFHEENIKLVGTERTQQCFCCARREEMQHKLSTRVTGTVNEDHSATSFSYDGTEYKLNDCVYMLPRASDEPHTIGQIIHIKCTGVFNWAVKDPVKLRDSVQGIQVTVQILRRYDDFNSDYRSEFKSGEKHAMRDNRRLYLTNRKKTILVDDRLLGKCQVVHPDRIKNLAKYKDLEDTFYVTDREPDCFDGTATRRTFDLEDLEPLNAEDFHDSVDGNKMVEREECRQENFAKAGLKLRAMDVFAGCGGMTSGLHEGGAVDTLYGIEWDIDAGRTLKKNFPHMKVYNENANTLLQRAIQEERGTTTGVMKDLQGKPMPPMPKRGEIDFLYGGPPCQDFSGCNRAPKANSIKNSLLTTFLSYVDHYRPKYFLLENVRGLLQHRLGSTQKKVGYGVQGGIQQGSVKFILRALTSLGYSAQFQMLQAAEHGSPQSRRRVFFWGSLLGRKLPLYPQPTHMCKGLSAPTNTFTMGKTAPHNPVTVGDAISDLPAFDWRINVPGEDRQGRRQRELEIPTVRLPTNRASPVGESNPLYAYEPITEFQREVRRYVKGDVIKNHSTHQWNYETMLRLARIPMRPKANHNDLPLEHDMACLRNEAASKSNFYPNRYYRLDFKEQFQTCLTNVDPGGENGKILHPTQRRILTVREFARAQGFLDTFTWDPSTQSQKAMYKQIGNAVSLQHGRALGKELFNALYAQWELEQTANAEEIVPAIGPIDGDESDELDEFEGFEGFDEDVEMEDIAMDGGRAYEEPISAMPVNTPATDCEEELGRLMESMNHAETTSRNNDVRGEYLTSNPQQRDQALDGHQLPLPSPSPSPRSTSPPLVSIETPETEFDGGFGKERSNNIVGRLPTPALHNIWKDDSYLEASIPPEADAGALRTPKLPKAQGETVKKQRETSATNDATNDGVRKLSASEIENLISQPESLSLPATMQPEPRKRGVTLQNPPKFEDFEPKQIRSPSARTSGFSSGSQRPGTSSRVISSPQVGRRENWQERSSRNMSPVRRQTPSMRGSDGFDPNTSIKLSASNGRSRVTSLPSEPALSPPSEEIPLPPLLSTYLELELASSRPSPLYIHRSRGQEYPYESAKVKFERLLNFLLVPLCLEPALLFGTLACLDAWLYTFTILPLRFIKAIGILASWWAKSLAAEARFVALFIYHGSPRLWHRRRGYSTNADIPHPSPVQSGQDGVQSQILSPRSRENGRFADTSGASGLEAEGRRPGEKRTKLEWGRRHRRTRSVPSTLSPYHKADILQGLVIIFSCIILMQLDASRMYHSIRGQAAMKLYVIYNVLEVGDRLLAAVGQDILECLVCDETLERGLDGRSKLLQPLGMFMLTLVYNVIHATALFYQVITLNVAVNSYSNSLFTLLLSNQFVEIKGTVFKRVEKQNLFQLFCADVVERFQLWLMLIIIGLRNIVEVGGLSILSNPQSANGAADTLRNATIPLRSSIIPNSFKIIPSWSGEVLSPFLLVLGSEVLVDWIKHCYVGKFNNVKPVIYKKFLDILSKDYYTNAFVNQNLTKRLGLPVIPLSCLFIRASVQTYHMFIATHFPPPLASTATSISLESEATASPATTAAMEHLDILIRKALGRSTYGVGASVEQTWQLFDSDDIISFIAMAAFFLGAFLALLSCKLVLGMLLLRYSRRRYETMNIRENVGLDTKGKRLGGLGMVELGEEKRNIIYEDDPDGAKQLKEREKKWADQAKQQTDFDKVTRYEMVAKRICQSVNPSIENIVLSLQTYSATTPTLPTRRILAQHPPAEVAMSFGFSAGDFIAALELVATVIDALRESGGASSEYREIVRQLYSLETALIRVKRLEVDPAQNAELVSLQQAAAQCQQTIDDFLKKVQKYQPHLRAGCSSSRLKDGWMKIQWAVCKKEDVARFKADLVGHTESIQLLLMAMQMASASASEWK
ncbi:hypothetical protein ACLOAV_004416 [Pseudogymnoascus australis]